MSVKRNPFSAAVSPPKILAAWKRPGTVGVASPSYGTEKISYGVSPVGYSYCSLRRIPLHRMESKGTFLATTPVLLDYPVELVHTFNELPLGVRPFVVSFENELPRYLGEPKPWQLDFGFRLLESRRCRRLLALSEAAAKALRSHLTERKLDWVSSKISVFRGTVNRMPQSATRNLRESGPLRLLFVGRDAFGKGLLPTLDAVEFCRAHGADIELTVVCNFERRQYISKGRDEEKENILKRMTQLGGVTHFDLLPNSEIHRLMQCHDVFAFPTLDESLGWVAVEAAMAGMPVIATNIFAIPELVVHEKTGFLIPIQCNESGRWSGLWANGLEFDRHVDSAFEALRTGISDALLRFYGDRSLISEMGDAGRRHIHLLYGTAAAQRQLCDIYDRALNETN